MIADPEHEPAQLTRLVNAYLDVAEDMALRKIPMTMQDWETRLNRFLAATDREVLADAAQVTVQVAAQVTAQVAGQMFSQRKCVPPTGTKLGPRGHYVGTKSAPSLSGTVSGMETVEARALPRIPGPTEYRS